MKILQRADRQKMMKALFNNFVKKLSQKLIETASL